MRARIAICSIIGLSFLMQAPLPAQTAQQVDEIVVTARRTGIPVWRVTGPKTSIVLIGSITGVDKGTRWDPGALTQTLRMADRVMFPNMLQLTGSPFALIGALAKWRKQATLPKGQSLADYVSADQFQRLVALQRKGVLKAGFERKHPFHLALDLQDLAEGKSGNGLEATRYVRSAVKKYKLKTVPITSLKAKPVLNDYFASPPKNYVPCLLDTVAVIEAGSGAIKARSDAWAERRVGDVLASPADKMYAACTPVAMGVIDMEGFAAQIRRLMDEPQLTVAVVELRSLARPNGVLDNLAAAGFKIQGPAWKR
jgi:uncharacterized protein YbaP (TraB family)